MSEYQELQDARSETVHDIVRCLVRLACARYLLSPGQRMVIAEQLRTVADEFDRGATERLRHRISLGRYEFVTAEGPNGRPLYRLAE
jgi:hypothetical protein